MRTRLMRFGDLREQFFGAVHDPGVGQWRDAITKREDQKLLLDYYGGEAQIDELWRINPKIGQPGKRHSWEDSS